MSEKDIERWMRTITPREKAPQPWTIESGGSWDMLEVQPIPDSMMAELAQRYHAHGCPWNARSLPLSPGDREYMYLLYYSMQGLVARVRAAERRVDELESGPAADLVRVYDALSSPDNTCDDTEDALSRIAWMKAEIRRLDGKLHQGAAPEQPAQAHADVPPPMPDFDVSYPDDSFGIRKWKFAYSYQAMCRRDEQWQQRIHAHALAGEPPMPPKYHPRGAAYVYTEQAVAEFAAAWKQREADLLERIRALSARPADTPPAPDEAEVQRVLGYLRGSEAEVRAGKEQIVWADTMARAADLIRNLAAQPDNHQHQEQGNG